MKPTLPAMILAATILMQAGGAVAEQVPSMTPAPRSDDASRATRALNMLQASGNGQYSNFAREGRRFAADVVRNGTTRHVTIDPDSGQITTLAQAGPSERQDEATQPAPDASGSHDWLQGRERLPGGPY